jgi:hypothetical protein
MTYSMDANQTVSPSISELNDKFGDEAVVTDYDSRIRIRSLFVVPPMHTR